MCSGWGATEAGQSSRVGRAPPALLPLFSEVGWRERSEPQRWHSSNAFQPTTSESPSRKFLNEERGL
jgi:hypothetical protein